MINIIWKMDSNSLENDFLNKEKILLGKYKIINSIEKNKNLQIYEGKNIISDESIIIKIEQKPDKKKKGLLETEFQYLNYLKSPGIPTISKIGYFKNNIISIRPKLGISLSNLFKKYYGNFKIKDITMIAIQILEKLKYIHSKNIIYCDINPKNFSLGIGRYQNIIYMTNFNSAKRFRDQNTLEHNKYKISNKTKSENYIFASINVLRGVEPSRRDDLESLGYMLIYFLKGGLPWENMKAKNCIENERKIYQIKKFYSLSELCVGIPEEFKLYLNYVKSLKFYEEPDYNYCFSLFYEIFKKMNIINDGIFSWYQEKNKEDFMKKKKFYKKLWENKYFNNSISTNSIINRNNKDKIFSLNLGVKKSNSCFLNIHNCINHISNFYKKENSSIINNKNKEKLNSIKNKNLNDDMKVNIADGEDGESSIEEKLSNNNFDKGISKDKLNKSFSSEKEYSIEGKIEQEVGKKKAYAKKQIGINIKKSFNKAKNNNNYFKKSENIQKELFQIKKRIIHKKKKEEKSFFNKSVFNKTFINNNMSNKYLYLKKDMLYTDFTKKYFPFIKSGNSTLKNKYITKKIKFLNKSDKRNKEEYSTHSNFSQIDNKSRKRINNLSLSNNHIKSISNINIDNKSNENNNRENISSQKQKKKILLNLDKLLINTQQLNNESNKFINIENILKKNKKCERSFQYSLNLGNNEKDLEKSEIIKVIKKSFNKRVKTESNVTDRKEKINVYEHKPLSNKYKKVQIYKKNSGVLTGNSKTKEFYYSNYNNQNNNKKQSEKIINNYPLPKKKNSKKEIRASRNIGKNKRIFSTISPINSNNNNKINNLENEIELGINNNENNVYNTIRNNNTIFSNFNKLINKKINNKNYIYTKSRKIKNPTSKNKKNKEYFQKYVKISNSPIIHNSISKLNLIQNVSNIYVTNSYLEEKPLTDRKNKVLTSRTSRNKTIYIKPTNKLSQDLALLNKGNIADLILELNNQNKGRKVIQVKNEKSQNYYFSQLW